MSTAVAEKEVKAIKEEPEKKAPIQDDINFSFGSLHRDGRSGSFNMATGDYLKYIKDKAGITENMLKDKEQADNTLIETMVKEVLHPVGIKENAVVAAQFGTANDKFRIKVTPTKTHSIPPSEKGGTPTLVTHHGVVEIKRTITPPKKWYEDGGLFKQVSADFAEAFGKK
jgi:hypothetical protein